MANEIDWSQFTPVAAATPAAAPQPEAVDWSQFQPVESPGIGTRLLEGAQSLGAGAANATLGIAESIWRTPETALRMLDAGGRALIPDSLDASLPSALTDPKYNPLNYPVYGADVGGQHFAGTSDVANQVNAATGELPSLGEPFARVAEAGERANVAGKQALTGDFSGLKDVVTDPDAIAAFVGQAAPSLYTAWKSGGSLPFMAWLEGVSTANDAADFERRTGQPISNEAFTQAVGQSAAINSILEKFGLDALMKGGSSRIGNMLLGGVKEAGTEMIQQGNTNLSKRLAYDPTQDLTEGVVASGIGGGGTGMVGGVMSPVRAKPRPQTNNVSDILGVPSQQEEAQPPPMVEPAPVVAQAQPQQTQQADVPRAQTVTAPSQPEAAPATFVDAPMAAQPTQAAPPVEAGPAPSLFQNQEQTPAPVAQDATIVAPERTDRRQDTATRKRIDEMTLEEARTALKTHELTGIPNKRAYADAPKKPVQVSVDADSLKWVNDNMGHESGDELLKQVALALADETAEAYHLSGDEFMAQADSEAEADALMGRVNERLKGATIEYTAPDGTVHRYSGIEVTYGKGQDSTAADAELGRNKKQREAAGQRAPRGEKPAGVATISPQGRADNQGDATPQEVNLPKLKNRLHAAQRRGEISPAQLKDALASVDEGDVGFARELLGDTETKPQVAKTDDLAADAPEQVVKGGENVADDQDIEDAADLQEKLYRGGTLSANPIGEVFDFARSAIGLSDEAIADMKKDWEATAFLLKKTKNAPKGKTESAWTYLPKLIGYSVDGQLRSLAKRHNSPTIAKIADMFNARPGEGAAVGETYGEAVDSRSKQYENTLFTALGKEFSAVSEAGEKARAQITRLIQNRSMIRRGTPMHDAAAKIGKMLDDIRAYAKETGMDIGEVKDYFPRIYDTNKITANQAGFVAAATKAYLTTDPSLTPEKAKQLAENWYQAETLSGLGVTEHPFIDMGNAIPNADFRKGREHGKAIDTIMRDFLVQDPMEVLLSYTRKVTRRAEWERRFGGKDKDGPYQKWRELQKAMIAEDAAEAIPEVVKMVQAATGELPASIPNSVRNTVSWVRALTVLHYLSHATVSSLSEPVIAGMRTGNLMAIPKTYWYSMKAIGNRLGMKNADMRQARQVAELFGLVINQLSTDSVAAHRFNIDTGQIGSEWANRLASRSTTLTGLHQWTEDNRTAMVKVAQQYVHGLAADLEVNANDKTAKFELRDAGIPEGKQKAFAAWVKQFGEPDAATLKRELDADNEMARFYRTAIVRVTNQVIQNPTHADKPYLASHPVASVAYTLMGYLYGFHKNVFQRTSKMVQNAAGKGLSTKERAHFLAPLVGVPLLVTMQYALLSLRELWEDPERVAKRTENEKLARAASYSGLYGAFDPLINMATSVKYERDLANALLGPYIGDVFKLAQDIIKVPSDRNSANTNTHERQIAKDIYNVIVDPAVKSLLVAQPIKPLGVAGLQAMSTHGVREGFIDTVAGEKTQKGRGSRSSGRDSGRGGRDSGR